MTQLSPGRLTAEPFHSVPGYRRGPRLLLISYHFPPGQATGALRWQKLARHAAKRGWQLDVITLDPSQLGQPDRTRLDELPPGTRIYGAPWKQAEREVVVEKLKRLLHVAGLAGGGVRTGRHEAEAGSGSAEPSGMRGSVAEGELPRWWRLSPASLVRAVHGWRHLGQDDGWAASATALAESLVRSADYRAVISCGPPHAAHGAAHAVCRRTGLPLILDLRDPWGRTGMVERYCASPAYFALLRRRETRAVRRAALVVVNTETHLRAMRAAHPEAADRMICVFNGCDEDGVPAGANGGRFTIAYAGNIYFDRDPGPLFRAASRVIDAAGLTPDQFGIDLMGDVANFGGSSVSRLADEAGIGSFVRLLPRQPRAAALEFLSRASVLLSLPQSAPLCVPSKIFEYMQFEAWVLALAQAGSGTDLVLHGTGADVAEPDDEHAIAAILARRYAQFAAGVRPPRLIDVNPHLTRGAQADLLFDALERVLSPNGAARQTNAAGSARHAGSVPVESAP